ncbi:hypothetical protein D9M71_362910 [compost metagenome]
MGNGQATGNVGERGLQPGQPGSALVQAVFERWIQRVPECFQDLFGQFEGKADAFEMLSLGQPFAEPGYQHQVFALLCQPLS